MASKLGALGKYLLVLSGLVGIMTACAAPAFSQNPRNEIEVFITLPDGRPADHMPVSLLDDGYTEIAMHYTDAGGHCYFRGLSQGTFYIQLEPTQGEGLRPNPFRIQMGDVVTSGGEKFRFEMRLLPVEPSADSPVNAPNVFHQQVPPDAKLAYTRACASLGRDKLESGEKNLRRALEIFPSYYDALDRLGSLYVQRREYPQAVPLLRRAVDVNKRGWHAQYSLGVALLETSQRVEGLKCLEDASQSNPFSPNVSMRLGLELANDPKTYDEAIRSLSRAARLAGKDLPDAYFFLASLYTKQNKYAEAADALESYLAALPKVPEDKKAQYRKAIDQLKAKASQSQRKS